MKIILIDGNSFCYRAFYAIRDLRTSAGQPTNAVYGFVSILEKLLKDLEPDGLALMFDLKGPTFRHKRYDQYKIHRTPMPEDLVAQMPVIKELVKAYRIPIFEMEGYEADDVIATLAKRLEKESHDVFIATGDKDALQLVSDKVKVLNPQKENFVYNTEEVKKRFGVGPENVTDILALMGDASDNIPGVSGVGEKTATKLIAEYGSLQKVYENLDRISGDKLRDNLTRCKDDAFLSKELAELDCNVPLKIDLDSIRRSEPDREKLVELYRRLEFRTLLKNLAVTEEHKEDEPGHYTLIETQEVFDSLKKKLSKASRWAFHFETTGPNPMLSEPVGLSFSMKPKEAFYVRFDKGGDLFGAGSAQGLDATRCLSALKGLFEDKKIAKIGQNLKAEALVLRWAGIRLEGYEFDTMVASYCLNPSKPNHNLEDVAMEHMGIRVPALQDILGKGKNEVAIETVPIETLYPYGCQGSDVALRLADVLKPKLKEKGASDLFEEIEMPLVSILAEMEFLGVAIDRKLLEKISGEMQSTLEALTHKIHQEAGKPFNVNSPKQLAEILFDHLGLPMVKKTKTGASTDVEVLVELSEFHSLPKDVLKFRELSKLKCTYVDALPLLLNPKSGRVHTSFNQTVTATGRLSSSEPNLQNIPVRTEEGRKIRRAFVAGTAGTVLLSADYSQIELRVLAHLSGDERLIEAFRKGADIHRYTASLMFNLDMEKVTDSMRSSAKTVNFGVLYGMGAFSLAKTLDISNDAAKDFIKAYFERYPRVKHFLDETLEHARQDGFVSTVFNRRRYIPEIASRDPRLKSFAERTAINAPIQGTASDIIKIAMKRLSDRIADEHKPYRMILQVHDELLFEVPESQVRGAAKLVADEMSDAVDFKVPMDVSVKAGPSWLDMEDIELA